MTVEVDVRQLPKQERHPLVVGRFDGLAVGESLVLVADHDPRHLREKFALELSGSFSWDYVEQGPHVWRIRIGKLAGTALPRILGDTTAIVAAASSPSASGAVWKLRMSQRDLDSNIVRLPPDSSVDAHLGPPIDVLLVVLDGAGQLVTELDTHELSPGALVWLPRASLRQFSAGPTGLTYLTVHQRRQALVLHPPGRP